MNRIVFSELVERCQKELIRDSAIGDSAEAKYMGRINDVYLTDLPSQIDWRHIRKIASITTTADYSTGTIALVNGSTSVTGTSTVWTSANSNNMLIKASGYNEIYRATYVSSTSLTLDREWVEATDTSETYTLFQDRYAIASDFDRMILDRDKAVYYYNGGNKVYLTYKTIDEFEANQTYQYNDPINYTIKWVSGDPYILVNPPDTKARTLYYTYMPALNKMEEYDTGTITTLANAGTAVTGSGTDFDGFVTDTSAYDYYFRIDGDGIGSASKWYKIASADSDTGITLSDTYAGVAIAAGTSTYTISVVSLLPKGLDLALLYGAAIVSSVDQSNATQVKNWAAMYDKIVNQYRAVEDKQDYGHQSMKTVYQQSGARR